MFEFELSMAIHVCRCLRISCSAAQAICSAGKMHLTDPVHIKMTSCVRFWVAICDIEETAVCLTLLSIYYPFYFNKGEYLSFSHWCDKTYKKTYFKSKFIHEFEWPPMDFGCILIILMLQNPTFFLPKIISSHFSWCHRSGNPSMTMTLTLQRLYIVEWDLLLWHHPHFYGTDLTKDVGRGTCHSG